MSTLDEQSGLASGYSPRAPGIEKIGVSSILDHLPSTKLITLNGYVPQKQSLKFQKDRRIRKGTKADISDETEQPKPKPSVKVDEAWYVDNIRGDNPETPRRIRNEGLYNSKKNVTHSRIYNMGDVEKRTMLDLGIANNRRKMVTEVETGSNLKVKRNPLLTGDFQKVVKHQKLWQQERKIRDNGKQAKQALQWDTTKTIRSYADLRLQNMRKD